MPAWRGCSGQTRHRPVRADEDTDASRRMRNCHRCSGIRDGRGRRRLRCDVPSNATQPAPSAPNSKIFRGLRDGFIQCPDGTVAKCAHPRRRCVSSDRSASDERRAPELSLTPKTKSPQLIRRASCYLVMGKARSASSRDVRRRSAACLTLPPILNTWRAWMRPKPPAGRWRHKPDVHLKPEA